MGKIKTKSLIFFALNLLAVFAFAIPSLEKGLKIDFKKLSNTRSKITMVLQKGYKFTQKPSIKLEPNLSYKINIDEKSNKDGSLSTQLILTTLSTDKVEKITVFYQVCYGAEYCFPPSKLTF